LAEVQLYSVGLLPEEQLYSGLLPEVQLYSIGLQQEVQSYQ